MSNAIFPKATEQCNEYSAPIPRAPTRITTRIMAVGKWGPQIVPFSINAESWTPSPDEEADTIRPPSFCVRVA